MGYAHIDNLYKDQTILLLRECYALEKIHGTSAHVMWKDKQVTYFPGGEKHANFVKLFDHEALVMAFEAMGNDEVVIYGEAYGGSCQGNSWRYGKTLKFVAFDVKVSEWWLSVPNAAEVSQKLGLEFVHYTKVTTDLATLDAERDAPSVQAKRNGIVEDQPREGVVLRPLDPRIQLKGERICAKHKRPEERETKTARTVDAEQAKVLTDAAAVADEWVTDMRLQHVMDHVRAEATIGPVTLSMTDISKVISAMEEDVIREAGNEIVATGAVKRAIRNKAAVLFKARIQNKFREDAAQ